MIWSISQKIQKSRNTISIISSINASNLCLSQEIAKVKEQCSQKNKKFYIFLMFLSVSQPVPNIYTCM